MNHGAKGLDQGLGGIEAIHGRLGNRFQPVRPKANSKLSEHQMIVPTQINEVRQRKTRQRRA